MSLLQTRRLRKRRSKSIIIQGGVGLLIIEINGALGLYKNWDEVYGVCHE
jgi:hypothetical protein